MNVPELSIIIPFFNGESFIDRLLGSIKNSVLSLNRPCQFSFEVIIIIDSPESSDYLALKSKLETTFAVINVVVVKNETNFGVAATRNRGLKLCHGNYINFIDQDDEVSGDFFLKLEGILPKQWDFILLNGWTEYDNKKLNTHLIYYIKPNLSLKNLVLDDIIRSPGQVLIRKASLKGLEFPVTKERFGSDDKFFWISMFIANPKLNFHYVQFPLYIAHIHSNNYSHDRIELQLASLEAWKVLDNKSDLSPIRNYIKRNIRYLRFVTRNVNKLTLPQEVGGFYEWLVYFLRPNKLVRFFMKHR